MYNMYVCKRRIIVPARTDTMSSPPSISPGECAAAGSVDVAASSPTSTEAGCGILELIDGVLYEPGSYDHEGDDKDGPDGGGSTAGTASASEASEEMGELLLEGLSISRGAEDTITDIANNQCWSCPGATPDGASCDAPGQDPRCTHSSYGRRSSKSDLAGELGDDQDGGLLYSVRILPNDYNASGKKLKLLPRKDYDERGRQPKPRRKMPFPVTAADFFSSITRVGGRSSVELQAEGGYDDLWDRDVRHSAQASMASDIGRAESSSPRWVLTGVINGWPGLGRTPLEVRRIEGRDSKVFVGRHMGKWNTLWDCNEDGKEKGKDPSYSTTKSKNLEIRARLRAPLWSAHGWSASSPGYVFWVQGQTCQRPDGPLTVTYGTDLIRHFQCDREEDDPLNTRVHMISHRYATGGRSETTREQLTYHTLILLEWNHMEYCTVSLERLEQRMRS